MSLSELFGFRFIDYDNKYVRVLYAFLIMFVGMRAHTINTYTNFWNDEEVTEEEKKKDFKRDIIIWAIGTIIISFFIFSGLKIGIYWVIPLTVIFLIVAVLIRKLF
jgi:hypothetical protein